VYTQQQRVAHGGLHIHMDLWYGLPYIISL